MSRFLCTWLLAISLAQLTIQMDLGQLPPPQSIEFTIIAHRIESGQYVTDWKLKDSKDPLPEDAKLHVKTSVSESEGKRTLILQAVYTVPTKAMLNGYEYFPGVGYYKFYPKGIRSYDEAMDTCSNDGAHLAIINSVAEMEVLKAIFARHPNATKYAYLGFHDKYEEGKYVTIFGKALSQTGYEIWKAGEPNQYGGNEDCGAMDRNGGLNDFFCKRHFDVPFFCEYDPHMGSNYGNQ